LFTVDARGLGNPWFRWYRDPEAEHILPLSDPVKRLRYNI
jgi:hypothetical protein